MPVAHFAIAREALGRLVPFPVSVEGGAVIVIKRGVLRSEIGGANSVTSCSGAPVAGPELQESIEPWAWPQSETRYHLTDR
jgi:hypothetical protein